MTTLPQSLLSEQQIIDIARKCDGPTADQSQTTAFAHALESALLATLAQGVELEAHLYEFPTEEASFQVYAHCYEGKNPPANAIALVPLSTAQAAVAAERARTPWGQAEAWQAVCHVLSEVAPEWKVCRTSGIESAVDTIRRLAKEASPAPAAEPAPKQWPFVESPGAFTKRLRDALFDLDQDLLAAVRNVLIENPPQLATTGLAHELWAAAQLAPGEGVEDVTGAACGAVAEHVIANGEPVTVTANGTPRFRITVEVLNAKGGAHG